MNAVPIIIQIICGAIGGNATGKLIKKLDLGFLINSLAGILGGGLGGQLLRMLGLGAGGADGVLDLTTIISSIVSGGVGGGVLMAIVGVFRNLTAKK